MSATRIEIGLHPVQAEFIHSQAFFRGFVGGRGAGKSFVGSYDLLRKAQPGRLYMVVAPTYRILKDASFRSFSEHARTLRFLKNLNKSDLRVTLGNGAEVLFRSAENPDSLRGPNISGCWMDEASYCHEDAYKVVIACLREAGEQGWLSATFTPKGRGHWTFKVFGKNLEARRKNQALAESGLPPTETIDPNVDLYTAKTKDNPFLPAEFEATLRAQYTSAMAKQELEGEFMDLGGKLFSRAWFSEIHKAAPAVARWVRYWDKAATENAGCHTCGVLLGTDPAGRFYIGDVIRGQWSTFTREAILKETASSDASRYRRQVKIFVEQEPGSGGVDSLRSTIRNLSGYVIHGHRPQGDKRVRAEPFAAQCEAGNVVLIEPQHKASWIPDYLDELEQFPDGPADQVDASSGAFNRLTDAVVGQPISHLPHGMRPVVVPPGVPGSTAPAVATGMLGMPATPGVFAVRVAAGPAVLLVPPAAPAALSESQPDTKSTEASSDPTQNARDAAAVAGSSYSTPGRFPVTPTLTPGLIGLPPAHGLRGLTPLSRPRSPFGV